MNVLRTRCNPNPPNGKQSDHMAEQCHITRNVTEDGPNFLHFRTKYRRRIDVSWYRSLSFGSAAIRIWTLQSTGFFFPSPFFSFTIRCSPNPDWGIIQGLNRIQFRIELNRIESKAWEAGLPLKSTSGELPPTNLNWLASWYQSFNYNQTCWCNHTIISFVW